jgi:hypothetical protein
MTQQLQLFLLDEGDEYNRRFCDRADCRLHERHTEDCPCMVAVRAYLQQVTAQRRASR